MLIRDKRVKKQIEVRDKGCPKRSCYWPRPDPGVFSQGTGKTRTGTPQWLCGTWEMNGCPVASLKTVNRHG